MAKTIRNNTDVAALVTEPREYEVADGKISKLKVRVQKSGNKVFYLYYRFGGKTKKYRIGRFGEVSLVMARKVAETLLAKVALGEDLNVEKEKIRKEQRVDAVKTLRSFLDKQYYPFAVEHQKAFGRTKQIIEGNFDWLMSKRLDAISRGVIDGWSQKRLKAGIQSATINRSVTALKAVLNKAVEWEVIERSGLSGMKRLKVDKQGKVRWLSADEEKRLMRVLDKRADDPRTAHLSVIVRVLLNTGMRPVECFNLRWGDVDLENRQITVVAAFSKTSQTRHIPINDKLAEVLNWWKAEVEPKEPRDVVFEGDRPGEAIVSIQKGWKKILKDAEIEGFRLYDARHTFASKLVMKGVDLYTVGKLLGHSNTNITKIYAHLSDEHLSNVVNIL